ncbi:PT domain-containing protein [Streptomyces sp. NPDC057686]|uniref:PT domain-containing protein n=1 Tax=Streptomyces sp. NPDC057686 TaxID=3346212 RepID=UPI0036B30EAF
MRTALRTSIVTAALAGALLAPAATALAAPAPQAVTPVTAVTTVSADSSGKGRYDGEVHLVADGRIAVLRNDVEGPEVWIRAVGPAWKPADGVAGRVLAKLDLSNRVAVVDGIQYKLSEGNPGQYGLTVRVLTEGAADFYQLPKAAPTTTPSTKPSAQPSAKPSAQPTAKVTVKPAADVKPQTGAQTVVVPQGAVAAGAEIAAEDTDNSTTVAAGAGLVAILAGLGVALMARSRRARNCG